MDRDRPLRRDDGCRLSAAMPALPARKSLVVKTSRERDERKATGERPVVKCQPIGAGARLRLAAIFTSSARADLHFSHHFASVSLHGDLAEAELASDLSIQQAGDDQRHDLPFAAADRLEDFEFTPMCPAQ